MSSTFGSILNTARTSLLAHQQASQVTAHNLSNAATDGYSRQRVALAANEPLRTPLGILGTGVHVQDASRVRDALLDGSFRRESAFASGNGIRRELLELAETRLAGLGDDGLGATLDAFWDAWSDLASDPLNPAARSSVRTRGDELARHLNRLGAGIREVETMGAARLAAAVDRINELAGSIAELNARIVAAESGGHTASDLRDSRDRMLDELATLVSIEVVPRENGGIGVAVGGIHIVDGVRALAIELEEAGGTRALRLENGTTLSAVGGEVAGLIDALDVDFPWLRGELDTLARALAVAVNDLHRQGTNALGGTGIDFFHVPAGGEGAITAETIRLSDAVLADARAIAAGTPTPGGDPRPGANDIALALAQLRDTPEASYLGGRTFGDFYTGLVQELGMKVATARDLEGVHGTLASSLDHRRAAVSGVSTDEELIRLIEFQSAYSAAARVVTTVDEMIQTILGM